MVILESTDGECVCVLLCLCRVLCVCSQAFCLSVYSLLFACMLACFLLSYPDIWELAHVGLHGAYSLV